MGGPGAQAKGKKVDFGFKLTSQGGFSFSIKKERLAKVKWLEVENFTVTLEATPTASTSIKAKKTKEAGISGQAGADVAVSRNGSTETAAAELRATHEALPVDFIAGDLSTTTEGFTGSFRFGYNKKNANFDVKIVIVHADSGNKDAPVKIFIPGAVFTYDYTDIWQSKSGGPNYKCKIIVQVQIGPDEEWIARKVAKRAATRLARKLAGKGYGIAFAFVEGGYLTLEAAYKNIKAGANIKMIIPIIRNLAIEAANSFVAGATGKGGAGLGGPSGQRWSQSAFIYAQKEHPDITLAEFQAALSSDSPGARLWREQARAKINYLTRLALFQCFQRNPPDWADASSVKLLRETLFKGKLHDPSELSVKPPELYKIKKNPGYTKLPEHLTRRKEVPLVIQDEVRRRLRNHQPSGKIDHRDGITYWFRYNPASKTIEVYGEDMTSFVPFHG